MFHRRHMPVYLVIGWAVVDLLVLGAEIFLFRFSGELGVVLFLLLWGQFAAISGWVTLGNGGMNASMAALSVGPVLVGLAGFLGGGPANASVAFAVSCCIFCTYGVLLNLPLLIARSSGWQFHFEPPPEPDAVPFYQFSLREIMLYTVLVALVAGLWSATRPAPTTSTTAIGAADGAGVLASMMLVAIPIPWSVWAAFAWIRPIHGALVALLVTGLSGVLCVRMIGQPMPAVLLAMTPPAVMIVHVLALQAAGFRLQQHGPLAPPLLEGGTARKFDELEKKLSKPRPDRDSGLPV